MANLIQKNVEISVNGNSASLNEQIYLYKNDRNIDIIFTIVDDRFKFNEYSGNILVDSTAKFATIKVLKPNGQKFTSEKFAIEDNKVTLTITEDFIDQIEEVGVHQLQIQLWDSENGRVTIPPVSFTVITPIFDDDEEMVTVSCKRVDE